MRRWSGFGSEFGRSMIEMLGVLAIVGVLSIGGISGFQKAMNKHKINQVTEELSQFINELLRYSKDWRRMLDGNVANQYRDVTSMLDSVLPAKWGRQGRAIYDSADNKIYVAVRTITAGSKYISLSYRFKDKDEKSRIDLCVALYDMTKPYSDIIYRVDMWRRVSEASSSSIRLYGNSFCGGKKKCLKDATLAEMMQSCSVYQGDDEDNSFALFFPL